MQGFHGLSQDDEKEKLKSDYWESGWMWDSISGDRQYTGTVRSSLRNSHIHKLTHTDAHLRARAHAHTHAHTHS